MNNHRKLLIVFVKNPELGKVKTRLAKTIGDERALEIYHRLLELTHRAVSDLSCDKCVYYSSYIDSDDLWENNKFSKKKQFAADLGLSMKDAFEKGFEKGYRDIVLIGSDCAEISSKIIEEAFGALEQKSAVLGPASDGGYYLIGKNRLVPSLFSNKKWSTENVLLDTINDLRALDLSYQLLPTLTDLDTEEELYTLET